MDIISELTLKVQEDISKRYGESIPEFNFDGQIKRFNKIASWVSGSTWEFNGKQYGSVFYGCWKFADGSHRIDSFDKTKLKEKKFYQDFSARMELQAQKIEEEKEIKNKECREKWLPRWKMAIPDTLHEYLIDKGIEKSFGSRVDKYDVLIVPVYDHEQFNGVQRIYKNPENNSYEKMFSGGLKIKGSFYPLQKFKYSDLIYVTEGFATACSIQTAYPNTPVVCCFNAGNIISAIENMRKVNPSCKIVIAADRDKESNTGEIFARKACQIFPSCIYKIPSFKNDNGKWSDFNDLHQFESLKEVQNQLKVMPNDFNKIIPLGVIRDKYFYMSTVNIQVISISGHNHTEKHLYNLIPDRFWWTKNYPRFDAEDKNKENPIGTDWVKASNMMMNSCIEKGIFDYSNVRSSGVWVDSGKYYYHNGQALYNGSKYIDIFSDFLTKNYVMGKTCYSISKKEQLTEQDREMLMELFGTISTKTPQQGLLLMGWIMSASIAGALPWRPHIWLTGQSSAGKSWTMENVVSRLLEGFCIIPQGDSTEAGIRQKIGNQSLPIVFDEFETDDNRTSAKNEAIVSLARQASTPSSGDILRGTSDGSAMTFSPNFAMCASSINPNLHHKQDRNRWSLIEFCDKRANLDQFKKVQEITDRLMSGNISRKVVSYAFHNIDKYIANFNIIEMILKERGYKGHFCRQYASLFSGIILVAIPDAVEEQGIRNFILTNFDMDSLYEKTGQEDFAVFREFIMSSFIRVENENMTVEEVANKTNLSHRACMYQKALMRHGMRAGVDSIYIKRGANRSFRSLLKDTKWVNNWEVAIDRVEGCDNNNNKSVRINGESTKVYRIPFSRWSEENEQE